jgi:hypothetical protein
MANRKARTFLLTALAGLSAVASAWNDVGHRTIAAIANDHLTPAVRAEVERLLAGTSIQDGAVWADDVRRDRPNTGPWHYKDQYFRDDRRRVRNQPGLENAVWAIKRFTAVLADRTKSDAERGEALRWVLHFVGDIHQPLHAASRESVALPDGDRGGNSFRVGIAGQFSRMPRPPENLHALWDLGAGLFLPGTSPVQLSQTIQAALPIKSLRGVGDSSPDDWQRESFDIAKNFVYSTPENVPPSSEYLRESRERAIRRAALAGYRLAEVLNKALTVRAK